MADEKADLQDKLAALKVAYGERLSGQIALLEEASKALSLTVGAASWEQPAKDILEIAHKIAGSAGTFGMTELGLQGKNLEKRCEDILAAGRPPSDSEIAGITHSISVCGEMAEAGTGVN